jgi:hypothetical protein
MAQCAMPALPALGAIELRSNARGFAVVQLVLSCAALWYSATYKDSGFTTLAGAFVFTMWILRPRCRLNLRAAVPAAVAPARTGRGVPVVRFSRWREP